MLNEKIRVIMLKKGITTKELAEKTGTPKSTMYNLINTTDIMERPVKIAKALGCELNDLA